MKKMYILVNKYPNVLEPNTCVFIQQLVWTFADLGYECKVIAPLPITLNIKYLKFKRKTFETNENGINVEIFHPKYFSVGQKYGLFQKTRVKITTFFYKIAVNSILKKELKCCDKNNTILYSHFLCPAGYSAAYFGKKYGIKSFFAHGEALYSGNDKYGNKKLKKIFSSLTGAIAVSQQNKDFLIEANILEPNKISVFPNGFREERFFKVNRELARKKMGWNNNDFIVGFCGNFDERKGILRLEAAVDQIDNVYFACAGKGDLIPKSKKCLLKEPVNNDKLNYFYNAIDIFVMPTTNEGCCNAIVEAMACGCPIISSDKSFNYDILDSTNSIMIDPYSIEEIKNSIIELKNNDKKRKLMGEYSLKKSKNLTLKKRAKNIIKFIERN